MAEDLQRFLSGESILARRASPIERSWRWLRRNPVLSTACAVASVALITLAGVLSATPTTVSTGPYSSLEELPILQSGKATSLFKRPPLIFAWRPAADQQSPQFDPKSKSYKIHSPSEGLFAGVATHHEQPFVLEGNFSLQGDGCSAGFFWGLHVSKPDNIHRCYSIMVIRHERDAPWELKLEERRFEKQGVDRFVNRTTLFYDSRKVQLDDLDHVRLAIEVTKNKIVVRLNDQVAWEPKTDEWAVPMLPSSPAQLGILGYGSTVTFQNLLVRVLN